MDTAYVNHGQCAQNHQIQSSVFVVHYLVLGLANTGFSLWVCLTLTLNEHEISNVPVFMAGKLEMHLKMHSFIDSTCQEMQGSKLRALFQTARQMRVLFYSI